ncbi:ribosome assembly factor SBDS [archaeon]|nr:MAG: ribosome assembly factor SBDS [archaeon]
MVSIDDAIIARLKTHGEKFEVLVDPYKARKIKQGEEEEDFLASPFIYTDVGAADKASEDLLQKVFGTDVVEDIAVRIIRKGEVHLTAEQRKEILEEKKKKILTHISRHAVDPKSGLPHPYVRIENAFEKANIHIDLFKSSEKQIDEVIKALRPILPLRFEMRSIAVKIPSEYTGKAYGVFTEFGTLRKEEWGKDGTLYVLIEMPAGMQTEFYDRINALTKGDVEIKIIDKS